MGTFLLLWLIFLLILFSVYAVASANDRRLEQVERERQRIANDAIRVKAALRATAANQPASMDRVARRLQQRTSHR